MAKRGARRCTPASSAFSSCKGVPALCQMGTCPGGPNRVGPHLAKGFPLGDIAISAWGCSAGLLAAGREGPLCSQPGPSVLLPATPPPLPARFVSPQQCPGMCSPACSSPASAHPSVLCQGAGSNPTLGRGSFAPPAALPGCLWINHSLCFSLQGLRSTGDTPRFPAMLQTSPAVNLSCLPPGMHHYPRQGVPPLRALFDHTG